MNDIKELVVDKYDGSLKAEHGTGRNMAPFVKQEWGEEAFAIMKAVKQLFDPKGLFNPGVIFNDDPQCHIKHFKPLSPLTIGEGSEVTRQIDRCIECGFCEVNCLSCGFTLSSRQRIVIQREISRLKKAGKIRSYWKHCPSYTGIRVIRPVPVTACVPRLVRWVSTPVT